MKPTAKILVVDDECHFRAILGKALTGAGYPVESAASGEQALEFTSRERFQLVVTDLNMPGQDGIETILLLKGREPKMKIIAISGGYMKGDGNFLPLAATLGAVRILAKPFSAEDFLEAVRSEIGEPAAAAAPG